MSELAASFLVILIFIPILIGLIIWALSDGNSETENKESSQTFEEDKHRKSVEEAVKTPSGMIALFGKLYEWVKGLIPEKAKGIPLTWVLLVFLVSWNLILQSQISDLQSEMDYLSWHSHDDDYAEKRHDHDGDYAEPWHYH